MVFHDMKEAKNSLKKVTGHILKSKMLRKKNKYDPKYSGKPTLVENVAGNIGFRFRKQLPSLSGVVILLLIGYIAYEQMIKKSSTNVLETEKLNHDVANKNGKLLEDAPIELLDDVRKVGHVDQYDNQGLQRGNPKIQGVNEMAGRKQGVLPNIPHGQDSHIGFQNQQAPPRQEVERGGHLGFENQQMPPRLPVDRPEVHERENRPIGINRPVEQRLPQQAVHPQNAHANDKENYLQREVDDLRKKEAQRWGQKEHPGLVQDEKDYKQQKPLYPQVDEHVVKAPEPNDQEIQEHPPNQNREDILKVDAGKKEFNQRNHDEPPEPKRFPVPVLLEPKMDCSDPLKLLILVHTRASNSGDRMVIRETWGIQTVENYARFGEKILWKTIFVLGKSSLKHSEEIVLKEAKEHGDILQGDFPDSKYEDTRRFMMTMKWLHTNIGPCKPKYVLKTQDNIFHNMFSIIDWLGKKFNPPPTDLYMGRILRDNMPIRDRSNPLYVSYQDYGHPKFPVMIEGPVYLFTYETYLALTLNMPTVTPIAMEDGYIGAIAARVGIEAIHNDHFMLLRQSHNHCHNLRMFFLYEMSPGAQKRAFRENKTARSSKLCSNAKVVERDGRHVNIEM